jgi:phage protein D
MAQQTAIPVYQRGSGTETFYVPAFEIKIAGRGLPRDVVHDVMQVTYSDSINKIDSFEITINNWDAAERKFKYVGLDENEMKNPKYAKYAKIFDPGQELELRMGYRQPLAGNGDQPQLKRMMTGHITTLEPDFPNGGSPTLHVRDSNILNKLNKQPHTYTWENMRDSDIAEELGKHPVSKDRPGLGIEVRIDKNAASKEPLEPFVFMRSQVDILFLLERARRHGYSLFLVEDKDDKVKPYLYFGPSDRDTLVTYKLEWGKTLMQFRPTLTTTNQFMQVTVHSTDRHAKSPIKETARWGDAGIKINLDLKDLVKKELDDGRNDIVDDKPVYTVEQARAMARDLLLDHLKDMLKASGATVGLPDLRAGRTVQIGGLGKYFSGTYFITDTTHTIGNDGYRTTFNARREDISQQ